MLTPGARFVAGITIRTVKGTDTMNGSSTYRAVLFGPNVIAEGTEVDLEYVDGEYQDIVVMEAAEDNGETIVRSYVKGHETEEPIPYRFVEESVKEESTGGEPDVPN
jgi:3D (Asp-Asp-Asp) domain-containing protein